jgi:arginyl-tRNA synthetase
VIKELAARGYAYDEAEGLAALTRLDTPHEAAVITALSKYPETIASAAINRAPHALVHYLRELANTLHTYYNAEKWIIEEAPLRNARLTLVLAVQQVVRNGLGILGVSAPDSM